MARRAQSGSTPSLGERLAALEMSFQATLEALPDKIGIQIRDAVERLADKAEVNELRVQIEALRTAHSAMQGAAVVRDRLSDQVQEWLRALAPLMWPIVIGAYLFVRGVPG